MNDKEQKDIEDTLVELEHAYESKMVAEDKAWFQKHVLAERMKVLDNAKTFRLIFKADLKKFWKGNIFGFDIIGFDEWLECPKDVSTRDCVSEKYGEPGTKMIEKLLA